MQNIVVLVSGNGSNLQALIDANLTQSHGQIVGVISNRDDAYALHRARQAGLKTRVIRHHDYPDRSHFDQAIHNQLLQWHADWVVLAGFMRILTAAFVHQWQGKILNIHPSLLPAYKGLETHQRVLNAGDKLHGCSVHVVTPNLDDGPLLMQGIIQVNQKDDATILAQRVHALEHIIYPLVLKWLCSGQLLITHHGVLLDGQALNQPLKLYR